MEKARRRAGTTETFSISVDTETKRALRALADSDFDGNLSALITNFAEEARRRMAAGALLKRFGVPELTPAEADALQAGIDAELKKTRPKKRRAA